MKLLGVLISFALVGNVLVTKLDDYIKLVLLINDDIKQAREFMPQIIKNMVSKYEEYGIERLSYMLAVPDYIDVKLEGLRSDSDPNEGVSGELEGPGPSQTQIPDLNLDPSTVSEEGSSQRQTPELNFDPSSVPEEEKIDEELEGPDQERIPFINLVSWEGSSQNQIPDLNLDPSTVSEEDHQDQIPPISLDPEEESKISSSVVKTIIHLENKMQFQLMLKLEILAVKDRPEYERIIEAARKSQTDPTPVHRIDLNRPPNYDEKERIQIPTIKLENLTSVLEERRLHPSKVSRNRVIRSFGLESLARARREMTLEAITLLIRQNDPLFQDLYMMCRLVGAYKSIKNPRAYISSATLDEEEEHCVLLNITFLKAYVYRFINGEFWEVDPKTDNLDPVGPFLSELE